MNDDVSLPKVEIHVTEACNNRCAFCTTGWVNAEQSERPTHVPRERIRLQLEQAFEKGARRALFQGGEPTLRSDLGELIADARAIGYQATTIFTNARMAASRAGARALVDMQATWFQVSIQGGNAATHDASVCMPGAFEQTLRGTTRLLEMGQRVKVNTVLTVHAIESLPELARRLAALRPEEVGFDTVKPSDAFTSTRAKYSELVPHLSSSMGPIRDAVETLHRAHIVVRLTSFPACIAGDLAPFVSEEHASSQSAQTTGLVVLKRAWKWSNQVKTEVCAACAYDDVCGGLQQPYASHFGTSELRALMTRIPSAPAMGRGYPLTTLETDTTRALRRLFAHASHPGFAVKDVLRTSTDLHVLCAHGPRGETIIELHPRDAQPAVATTRRFSIRYVNNTSADARIVRAVHRAIARWEARIDHDEPDSPEPRD